MRNVSEHRFLAPILSYIYIASVIPSTIAGLVCRLLMVGDRMLIPLLRMCMISVRFPLLLSLSFLTLHICQPKKVDWEALDTCHGSMDSPREMHAICVEYQSLE